MATLEDRTIPLSEEALSNTPDLCLSLIQAYMYFGGEGEKRKSFIFAMQKKRCKDRDNFNQAPAEIRNAPDFDKMLLEIKNSSADFDGMLAGHVLLKAITSDMRGERPSQIDICIEAAKEVGNKSSHNPYNYRLSASTIQQKILTKFASAAHLWAATFYLNRVENFPEPGIVPCHASQLKSFLGFAEWLRLAGEGRTWAGKKPVPLLDSTKTIRFPAFVRPEPVELRPDAA